MPPQNSTIPNFTPNPSIPLRMGKFKASQEIVKESWALLKKDKEILWFPVLSAITYMLAIALMGIFFYFVVLDGNIKILQDMEESGMGNMSYVVLFVYYLVLFFIANFFEAGIFIIAHARFNGQDLSFSDGIKGAWRNIGKIFIWSLISATVGMILRIIADKSKILGRIVVAILGAAWSIMTYFSLPSLVIGQTSIKESFKESAAIIRKTWGEALIVNIGVGLFFSLLIFLVLAVFIIVAILLPYASVIIPLVILFIISLIFLTVISSSLGTIFKLALYEYARTGQVPQGFSPELIQNAIKK